LSGGGGKGAYEIAALKALIIAALLSERSLSAAARRAGVVERTIRQWLTEDMEFKAELVQARRAIFEAGVERAQALTGLAVETLCDLLGEKKCPAVRLGASRLLLEFSSTRLPGFGGEWNLRRLGDVLDTDPETLAGDTKADFAFHYISLDAVWAHRSESRPITARKVDHLRA